MSFEKAIARPDLFETYRFGRSRQRFRAPRADLDQPYIATIGGSETFGKFVLDPFPAILERQLRHPVANWGTPGAGPGFFLKDPVLLECCSNARICVITVMSAIATSNRLFSVYKRRNERLRSISEILRVLYGGVDLEKFRFSHNMLQHLYEVDADKFKVVELELRAAWIARMRELLEDIETHKVVLWLSERAPEADSGMTLRDGRPIQPAFVDREMMEAIAPYADEVVEYVASPEAAEGGPADRILNGAPEGAARTHPGATMHREAAEALYAPLEAILTAKRSRRWPI
ncbi:MAG: DUF6473 family protein [Pseudomonadota bacterium]